MYNEDQVRDSIKTVLMSESGLPRSEIERFGDKVIEELRSQKSIAVVLPLKPMSRCQRCGLGCSDTSYGRSIVESLNPIEFQVMLDLGLTCKEF